MIEGQLIIILKWPQDEDRGEEVYGPFENNDARELWVEEVFAAAKAGDPLLSGCFAVFTELAKPFEVQR